MQNCKSSEDISGYADSILPSKDPLDCKKVLLLRFEIDADISQLSQIELQKLNAAYAGRDVVVTINGKESAESSIHWREKGFKDFVTLQPFCDVSTESHQKLYQFTVDFLVQGLSNGQSGMNN